MGQGSFQVSIRHLSESVGHCQFYKKSSAALGNLIHAALLGAVNFQVALIESIKRQLPPTLLNAEFYVVQEKYQ